MEVQFGAATDIGKVRTNNEDQYMVARLAKVFEVLQSSLPKEQIDELSERSGHLLLVSDGMGGAAAGEQASAMVLQEVQRYMMEAARWFLRWTEEREVTNAEIQHMQKGLQRIDQAIIDASKTEPQLAGMGATLTVARIIGPDVIVVHVGDSRAYLFRNNSLQQITRDHTVTQMLVDSGALTDEQAKHHRMRNILLNVLGGREPGVKGEVHQLLFNQGDRLLLCTDGLTGPVPLNEMEKILQLCPDPQQACDALIKAALQHGGPDNATAVIANFF